MRPSGRFRRPTPRPRPAHNHRKGAGVGRRGVVVDRRCCTPAGAKGAAPNNSRSRRRPTQQPFPPPSRLVGTPCQHATPISSDPPRGAAGPCTVVPQPGGPMAGFAGLGPLENTPACADRTRYVFVSLFLWLSFLATRPHVRPCGWWPPGPPPGTPVRGEARATCTPRPRARQRQRLGPVQVRGTGRRGSRPSWSAVAPRPPHLLAPSGPTWTFVEVGGGGAGVCVPPSLFCTARHRRDEPAGG